MQIKDGSNIRRDSWTVVETVETVILDWTFVIQNNQTHRIEVILTNEIISMKTSRKSDHG